MRQASRLVAGISSGEQMGVLILLLIIRFWADGVARKRTAIHQDDNPDKYLWPIVRKMSWRVALAVVLIPIASVLIGNDPEAVGKSITFGIAFYPVFWLQIFLVAKLIVRKRRKEIGTINSVAASLIPFQAIQQSIPLTTVQPPVPRPPHSHHQQPVKLFLFIANEVKGPFSFEQIRGIITSGAATLETQCCKEGTEDWRSVSEFLFDTSGNRRSKQRGSL